MTRTIRTGRILAAQTVSHDFAMNDDKGRALGMSIRVERWEMETAPADAHGFYTMEPGVHFLAYTQTLRNGKHYGALTSPLIARNLADALKLAEERMARTKKTYAKKFAA